MVKNGEEMKVPVPYGEPEWDVLVPTAPGTVLRTEAAPFIKTFDGKRIGLFWNTKPSGEVFLLRVELLLRERFKDTKIIEFLPGKPNSAVGASAPALKEAAENCDMIILATGD